MTKDQRGHHVQDAVTVLKFSETSLYPLFQQDNLVNLARKKLSRHRLFHFILKLMKLCASKNAELPLDDAASVFYQNLFRMTEKVHCVENTKMAGEVSSFVDTRETIVRFTDGKLAAMTRAYTSFHVKYLVSTKEVIPLVPDHNVLTAFVFLQHIGHVVGNHWNSHSEKKHKRTISLENKEITEDIHVSDINIDCLVALSYSLKSSTPSILACLQLLSQTVEGCVQNLPHSSAMPKLSGLVSLVSSTMTRISKSIIIIIKGLIKQRNLDFKQLYELPELLRVILFSFNILANLVKKTCPDIFLTSTKVLKRTATDIGTMGKQLTQRKLYRHAIGLLSPLWPFPRMKELVQYVKHHETLCESYMSTGRIEEAWYVACKAVMTDLGFMSYHLAKVFVNILENHTSVFSQSECVKLLEKSMEATLENDLFDDISSFGSLLYFEIRTAISLKMTCGILMQKAVHFFNKWKEWYSSMGSRILTPKETLTASLSISFLRKVADIATVYFKNLTAVKALTEAYSLAYKMKLWDTVRDLMLTIVTLMPQLGLQLETDNPCNSPEMTDIFLEAISLENNDDLLRLVAIASYHLNTRQLKQFLLARDTIRCQISLACQRGDDQMTIDYTQGVIEKLEAEFLMMPGSRKLEEENAVCIEPVQTALDKIRSSHRHFQNISRSQFKGLLLNNKDGSSAIRPWEYLHQYLHATKLTGELCLYNGLSSDAEDYLNCGLGVAKRLILYTWEVIFSSRLTEVLLMSNKLDVAIRFVERTTNLIICVRPTLESGSGTCCGEFRTQKEPSHNLACNLSSVEKNSSSSCQNSSTELRQRELESLLGDSGLDRFNVLNQKPLQECFTLTDINNACSSCQSEIIGVCISLMAHQAEILWRKTKSICAVMRLLQISMDMSNQLLRIPPCTKLIDCMVESGWKFFHDMKLSNRALAGTAYKCAEIYAHSLLIKGSDSPIICDHVQLTMDNILGLLETAEVVGKKVGEFYLLNTIVASALLLRCQLKYLTVIQTLLHDDGQDVGITSDNVCSPPIMETIASAVNIAAEKKREWDDKRSQMLWPVKEDGNTCEPGKSLEAEQSNYLFNTPPGHLVSTMPASELQTCNVADESSLKSCCTVGAVSGNPAISSTKDVSDNGAISNTENMPNNSIETQTNDVPYSAIATQTKDMPDNSIVTQTKDVSDNSIVSQTKDVPDNSIVTQTKNVSDNSIVTQTKIVPDNSIETQTNDVPYSAIATQTKDMPDNSIVTQTKDVSDNSIVSQTKDVPDNSIVTQTKNVSDNSIVTLTKIVPDNSIVTQTKDVPDNSIVTQTKNVSDNSIVTQTKDILDNFIVTQTKDVPDSSIETYTKDVSDNSSLQTGNYCTEAEEKPDFNDSIKDGPSFAPFLPDEKSAWMKQLRTYFPTVAACQNGTQRMTCLQTAFQQLQEVPHFWLYRQICQAIALCLWEKQMTDAWAGSGTSSKQAEIAAYLTESMHVTFQHKMAHNLSYKLSMKHFLECGNQEEAQIDKQAMKEALKELRFGDDIKAKFQNRLALIPTDWTVVQMTIVNFDPANPDRGQIFVTRLQHDQEPLTLGLPVNRCQILSHAQRAFQEVMFYCHYSCLAAKSEHIQKILLFLQEVFLAGHKWLLRGQLECMRQTSFKTFLDQEGRKAVLTIHRKLGYHNLLEIMTEANEADVLSMVESMWRPHVAKTLAEICMDVQQKLIKMCRGQWSDKRGPVVLILDNKLTCFPWESMPDLISDTVTRIPCLASLTTLWTLHIKMAKSPFKSGVQRDSVTASVIFYSERLDNILSGEIEKELKKYQDWNICTESIHESAEKLEPVFKNCSLYLFAGHGWSDYSILENVFGRAFTVLICCCGGILHAKGKLDGDGAPLYFLMAGSPAVMGNLWIMFGPQCNIMASMFSFWMSQSQPISPKELVDHARQDSRSIGFHTLGLVTYGLPVLMN